MHFLKKLFGAETRWHGMVTKSSSKLVVTYNLNSKKTNDTAHNFKIERIIGSNTNCICCLHFKTQIMSWIFSLEKGLLWKWSQVFIVDYKRFKKKLFYLFSIMLAFETNICKTKAVFFRFRCPLALNLSQWSVSTL